MHTSQKCPACGADMTPDASGERCLHCLLQLGLETDELPPGGAGDKPLSEDLGDQISHYKLFQQIGEGGCGVAYTAEQEEPVRQRVAIKVHQARNG